MNESDMLSHDALERLIPHAGSMCLLDGIVRWDDETIEARAARHHDAANPLRSSGSLHAVNAVEYAAQAAAVHGALCGGQPDPAAGYLAGVRQVSWRRPRLDDLKGELTVRCRRLMGDGTGMIYEFEVGDTALGDGLVRGRLTVFFSDRVTSR